MYLSAGAVKQDTIEGNVIQAQSRLVDHEVPYYWVQGVVYTIKRVINNICKARGGFLASAHQDPERDELL